MSALASVPPAAHFEGLFADRTPIARSVRGADILVSGLTKSFGDLAVLKGIDLEVPSGQFLAIVGRSGCGKSTLLRILAGLDQPDDGSVALGQSDAAIVPRIMFQEPRLLPWARVLANVEVGLAADGQRGDRDRALATLAAVGLSEKVDQWPAVLSGGQKQRVALARALVSRPRLLVLDEPLGALDALTRIEMQALLERVWQAQGFTAVLVTHDVSEALTLADRVVMIEDGRIVLDLEVPLERPRRRGSVDLALLEERILRDLLREEPAPPDYVI